VSIARELLIIFQPCDSTAIRGNLNE